MEVPPVSVLLVERPRPADMTSLAHTLTSVNCTK